MDGISKLKFNVLITILIERNVYIMTRFFLAMVTAMMLFASASVYAETKTSFNVTPGVDPLGSPQICGFAGLSNKQYSAAFNGCVAPQTRSVTADVSISNGTRSGGVGGSYNPLTRSFTGRVSVSNGTLTGSLGGNYNSQTKGRSYFGGVSLSF